MHNVSFSYRNKNQNEISVLEEISANFEKSSMISIFGPSGSGKTTLLALLGGLERPSYGQIALEGQNLADIGYSDLRKKHVTYIFQNYLLFPYMTGIENILVVLNPKANKLDNLKIAEKALSSVNISNNEMTRKVKYLSGGQQQRIAIARCLAMGSDYILADEPTGNLDNNTANVIIDIFKTLTGEYGKCVIIATHSNSIKEQSDFQYEIVDKKMILRSGEVVIS